jgi:hypothetical protein
MEMPAVDPSDKENDFLPEANFEVSATRLCMNLIDGGNGNS